MRLLWGCACRVLGSYTPAVLSPNSVTGLNATPANGQNRDVDANLVLRFANTAATLNMDDFRLVQG